MKILITGATGYIGRQLTNSLAVDHEIFAVVREYSKRLDPAIVRLTYQNR
jgi:nucleoside-diphosphate-sugar epimerase